MRPAVARFFARAISQTLPHLAIFAVMLLAFASNASAAWTCEGEKCGVTAWTCCCAQPGDTRDAACGQSQRHFTRGDHAAEAGACALDCHCTMTVQSNGPSVASTHFSPGFPPLFVVPVKFEPTFEALIFTESPRPFVSRGPPTRAVYLASLPLRGPPVA